jgi:Tol biopolymer transport system component
MRYLIAVIGLAAALYGADAAREQKLQKAIDLMETKGDLAGAIAGFEDAAKSPNRAVAARALLYLAGAQERQRKEKARVTYERIARDFGDQRDIAAQARGRLAALDGPAAGKTALTARQLWTGKDIGGTVPFEIAPASDGRSLLFIDWHSGDVGLRDMGTGEIKRLGFKKAWAESGEFAQFALYSPDQRQIAYTWHAADDGQYYDFRVISTAPGAKPRELIKHPELIYFKPFAWSSDGKSILTLIWKKDGTTQIAWVSAADGSTKTLKSLEWRQPELVSLSPDGRYIAYDALERKDSTDRDIFILAADGSGETAAVKSPGIDDNPVWTPDGSHLIFRSNRSRNFGLYALAVRSGKTEGAPKLLKPDVGRILLRGFVRTGALYYLQLTGEQNVYLAELDLATGNVRSAPVPLASTYAAMNGMPALSPDGKQVAYLSTSTLAVPPALVGGGGGPGASSVVVKSLESGIEKAFPTDLDLREAPVWFPDGRALLLNAQRPAGGMGRAFHKLDLHSGRVTLAFDPGKCCMGRGMAFSSDGDTLYTIGGDRDTGVQSVLAVSLATGQVKTLYQTKAGPQYPPQLYALALSPDGRTLAVVTNNPPPELSAAVVLMGTDGSGVRTLYKAHGDLRAFSGVTWSSDGKQVLFVHQGESHRPGTEWPVLPATGTTLWRMPVSGGEPSPTGIRGPLVREIQSGPNGMLTYTDGLPKQAELWRLDNLLPVLKTSR